MHLLGHHLADHKPVRIALKAFYGMGYQLSSRLLARLQIHHHCLVQELTEPQITALSSYLSSTATASRPAPTPLSTPPPPPKSILYTPPNKGKAPAKPDPLDSLKIETDLKKSMLADIAHLREIGTYRGKRIAAGYPARGQRTKTNALTAGRLNRVERRRYTTAVSGSSSSSGSIPSPASRPFASSNVLSALRSLPSPW
ncbi:30s ribosomal protein s13 [Papiliotrema laurentii]|uniref:30s ribosomal protein s13 n=1 Tax=Papiliotrema laurentii TaxID=5418 RepID=A0AAD9FQP3_PAPLA|nr:30s ribosomal protein s13 [Papiliotrema laurentii]